MQLVTNDRLLIERKVKYFIRNKIKKYNFTYPEGPLFLILMATFVLATLFC